MKKEDLETFYPASRQEWRQWLQENHSSRQSVWLVQYKMKSGMPTISWSEAVDEALCFGWIDSTRKSLNHETFIQFFCKRKPNSVWSKINKAKVQKLMEEGLMVQAWCKRLLFKFKQIGKKIYPAMACPCQTTRNQTKTNERNSRTCESETET